MRLQPMRLPQALNGAQADADRFRHGAAGPMRRVARGLGAGQVQHLGDDPDGKRRAARLARLIAQQAFDALLSVSCLPAPDRRSTGARAPRHFLNRQTISRIEHNLRPPHMFERAIAIRDDGQQTLTIFGGRKDTVAPGSVLSGNQQLWVSALEILSHPRVAKADLFTVYPLFEKLTYCDAKVGRRRYAAYVPKCKQDQNKKRRPMSRVDR